MRRDAAFLTVGALTLALSACGSPPSRYVDDASIDTAVFKAADRALQLGKRHALTPDGVAVRVGLTDAYGNGSQADALTLRWPQDALDRINWKDITRSQLLDLAEPTVKSRYGAQALYSWCYAQPDTARFVTPRFCAAPYLKATSEFMTTPTKPNP
jgi:hypothetical protein